MDSSHKATWLARYPVPLHDDYVGVDELRLEDTLALVSALAGGIRFYGAGNRPQGSWERLVQSDEIFLIGRVLAIDLNAQRERFRGLRGRLRAEPEGSEFWWSMMERLPSLRLGRLLDDVLRHLSRLQSVAAMRSKEKIENVIVKSLASEIQALEAWCRGVDPARASGLFDGFLAVWHEPGQGHFPSSENLLRNGFNAFFSAVQHLQDSLRIEFAFSLQRPDHDPAVGLLVAFLQLRQRVQRRLNRFPARQLDLYYDDILRVAPRALVPDRAILLLQTDMPGRDVLVPAGTLFLGGLDAARQERIYASVDDLRVSDARVTEIQSFWFERSDGISPENLLRQTADQDGEIRQYATAARIQALPVVRSGEALPADLPRPSIPPFGAREPGQGVQRAGFAPIGIALASKALAMKQGRREIHVSFEFASREGAPAIEAFVEDLSRLLDTTRADAFFKAFRNAFRISITEESGWYDFDDYLPGGPCVDDGTGPANSLRIALQLPPDAGAVIPADAAMHGPGYDPDLPVLRFELNEAYLYPYSLFADLTLLRVGIEVRVEWGRDILAYNQLGRLSTASQFYPFGATPVVGDYLIIGCEEAAGKNLGAFELDIAWAGLPTSAQGFTDYYRGYPTAYTNQSFKVNLAGLADRYWLPSKEQERVKADLFETRRVAGAKATGPVSRRRRLDLGHLCKILRPEESASGNAFGYDISTRSGFVKLTLSAPESAFGHRDYPAALYAAVARASRKSRLPMLGRLRKEKPAEAMPMTAYTPVIDYLTVNYRAHDDIDLRYGSDSANASRVYHIHPTGLELLRPGRPEPIGLVPRYREDGHLLIGITASRLGGPLTLFFDLKDDSRPVSAYRVPRFHWYYLSDDEWIPLPPDRIIADGTYGFLKPGVIRLDIPSAISASNRLCRPGLYWLRISAAWEDVANVCSLLSIDAHGVEVEWRPESANTGDHLVSGLRPGSIVQSRGSLPGIGTIRQPLVSAGGKLAETRQEKILRVSRRLRHKQRAVTANDYESLVLQEFPDLHAARCFPCCAGDPKQPLVVSPGKVFIVVLPQLAEGTASSSGPMVDALQLNEITRFVTSLASDAVKVTVGNPSYERIQVRCKVRLKQGQNPGEGIAAITRRLEECFSPWSPEARIPAFGWRIRCIDAQAYIQNLGAVTLATGVSFLQIGDDDGRKVLIDSARGRSEAAEPRLPWSVALPFSQHLIEVVGDTVPYPPSRAGYGNLAIGSTFIGTRGVDD